MKTIKVIALGLAVACTTSMQANREWLNLKLFTGGIEIAERSRSVGLKFSPAFPNPLANELFSGRIGGQGIAIYNYNKPFLLAGIFTTLAYLPKGIERAKEIYNNKKKLTLANAQPVLKAAAGLALTFATLTFQKSRAA